MSLSEAWDERAGAWIAWARAPEHDGFWTGTSPELAKVIPPAPGDALDLGCGEGRAGRLLVGLGYRVVGIEHSAALASAALRHPAGFPIIQADAACLPVADAALDLVVACMSLMDIDDLNGAVHESARVLRPGGSLCVSLVHPFASAQGGGRYLDQWRYQDDVERDGLAMSFVSMHRPLSAYFSMFASAGLVLDTLTEHGTDGEKGSFPLARAHDALHPATAL